MRPRGTIQDVARNWSEQTLCANGMDCPALKNGSCQLIHCPLEERNARIQRGEQARQDLAKNEEFYENNDYYEEWDAWDVDLEDWYTGNDDSWTQEYDGGGYFDDAEQYTYECC